MSCFRFEELRDSGEEETEKALVAKLKKAQQLITYG